MYRTLWQALRLILEAKFGRPIALGASSPKQGLEMAALWRKRLKPPVCPRPCCKPKWDGAVKRKGLN